MAPRAAQKASICGPSRKPFVAGICLAQAASTSRLKARQTTPSAYCSSSDSKYLLSPFSAPVKGSGSPNGESTWQLNIDDTSSGYKQKVVGFGAAVTDATVAVFDSLPSATLQELLQQLLTSSGVNFSLLRHTIASSDLSAAPAYTYDDAGGNADTSLADFNLGDRGQAMASLLAQMRGVNSELTILGSSWSPPGWMKNDGELTGSTTNNDLNHAYSSEFASYFVKYLQAYASANAHIDAITIQNEPLNNKSGFPTMYVTASEAAGLIQSNVGPALRNAGLSTQIWAYDHNTDQPGYPQTVLNGASEYVNAVAWHCYADPLGWAVLTDFHQSNPSVAQYMTECWTSSTSTSWNWAADFTMGPLQNWAAGAIAWTLGTDTDDGPHLASSNACSTCRGLVTVNTAAGTYAFQIDYYMMGQFSKFIPRGATVLSGTGSYTYSGGGGVQSVATLNPDGARTVVIENTFGNDIYVTLTTKSGETWSGNIYTNSVVTWLLPAIA